MKLAAIIVGVLILTTGAAAYQVYTVTRPTPSSSPAPVFSYAQFRNFSFVAQVLPSLLYNSTTVTGGNTTLFTALTQSVNVSYSYTVATTIPTTFSVDRQLTVRLQTSLWSKTVHSSTNQYAFSEGNRFVVSGSVLLNVSSLQALVSQIGNETGFTSEVWAIAVVPAFSGSLSGGGSTVSFAWAAPIWFNVSAGEIVPGGFNATQSGSVPASIGDSGGASGGTSFVALLSYALLAASAGGLVAAAVWLAYSERATPDREFERLTSPYAEVTVGTRTRPRPAETIRLSRWEDIVKVADTTGRPILRIDGPAGEPPGRMFFVLDGTIGYVYVYSGKAGGLDETRAPGSEPPPRRP